MVISRDLLGHASELVQQGRLPEAREALRCFLAESPAHAQALHLAGVVELMSGAPGVAVGFLRRCIEVAPTVPFAWSNLGVALNGTGDFINALDCFQRTLELQPGNATALKNQGVALRRLGRHEEAMASFRRAAQREPNDADLHREVGDLLADTKRFGEAITRYDRALSANPRDAVAHHNRGFAAWNAGQTERAIEDLRRAIALDPSFARAHSTLGTVLASIGAPSQALECHARAIALDADVPAFHVGLGLALSMLARDEEAIAAYDRALAISPDDVAALAGRGTACRYLQRDEEALANHGRAFALAPERPYSAGNVLLARLALCDWEGYDEVVSMIVSQLQGGLLAAQPMAIMAAPVPAALLRRSAELHAGETLQAASPPWRAGARVVRDRIRVGYFSAEFREHPVAHLLAPLLENHDKTCFETIGFSLGRDAGSPMRARLVAAFDAFEDASHRPDAEIAALARERGIDIAVDLMGYTGRERTGIFGLRPAPIQAQFLGFAGTMGTDCIDYLIADANVIPPEDRIHYREKIVALPDTALVAELARPISAATPGRASLGLPEEGFVFCCFCNRNKITPDAFDAWMRLLAGVEGSVLWLARGTGTACANLGAEARRRGVDPARLVFAERTAHLADHFARLRAADLFLDTFHYNGHVTTSDALFAGLPVLARRGATFASRVSSSLLQAVGLPELIAETAKEYEAIALRLAGDAELLAALRRRLEAGKASSPAFDVPRLARHLESAFTAMVERDRAGLPPDHIAP